MRQFFLNGEGPPARALMALRKGLSGFSGGSIDPFHDIDPFDQAEANFNITPVVNCTSEEYVEEERVFAATDDDDDDDDDNDDDDDDDDIMTVNSYLGPLQVMTNKKK